MPEFNQLASSKALAIPEIVEIILLHSDMRTVLITQRTCQTWNNAIREFPSIQKHLFFKPIGEIDGEKVPNPLLSNVFSSFFPQERPELFSTQSMDIIRNPHKAEAYIREEASWRRMLVQQPPANGLALLQVHTRDVDHPFEGSRYKVLSNEKEQDLDLTAQRNGLRMETFFELMMLDERVQFDPGVSVMLFWGQRVQDTIWIYANGLPVEHLLGRQLGTFDILVIMRNHFHGDYCVDTDGLTNEEERYRSDQIFYYYGSFNSRVKPRATKQVMHLEFEQDEFLPDM